MAVFHDVCAEEDLQAGHPLARQILGVSLALFRIENAIYAIENLCTHDDEELHDGCLEGEEIECRAHGARFHIPSGAALTAPAFEDLRTFDCSVEQGRILVKL